MMLPVVAFAAAASRQVVAPAPAAVGVLDRVVQDAAPQRRLRARRVERDRALEDLVEALEVLGAVDELRDRAGLLAVHARRHVDEHKPRTMSGARSASAIALSPPSDMPTTSRASGASSRTAFSIATAFSAGQYA